MYIRGCTSALSYRRSPASVRRLRPVSSLEEETHGAFIRISLLHGVSPQAT